MLLSLPLGTYARRLEARHPRCRTFKSRGAIWPFASPRLSERRCRLAGLHRAVDRSQMTGALKRVGGELRQASTRFDSDRMYPPVSVENPSGAAAESLAAEELVRQHCAGVYNLAYRTLGRPEDAEDIAQHTFLRALVHLPELRAAEVRGWLFRVAGNLCIDEIRRRGRRADAEAAEQWTNEPVSSGSLGDPERVAELHELRLIVWRATLALPTPTGRRRAAPPNHTS